MHRLNALLLAALVALGFGEPAVSQTVETKYISPDPGSLPFGALTKTSTGAFIGATSSGGLAGFGAIFQVTTQGEVTRLASFNGSNGTSPTGPLTRGSDGKYYGITRGGGSSDRGTAFRVSESGDIEQLVSFSDILKATDSIRPVGRLIQGADGNFYGYCGSQSSSSNPGLIFKLTPSKVLTVLARFKADKTDGADPTDGLVALDDSTFLGVTSHGGLNDDKGVVFKVTTSGVITRLVDFDGSNGSTPQGALVKGSDGNFYGTTQQGGTYGTVYKLTPADGLTTATTVATFDFAHGAYPQGALIEGVPGTFFGMTLLGGSSNKGTVFSVTPGDANPAITNLGNCDATLGINPYAGLALGDDGALYGTASSGGATNNGSIVKLTTGVGGAFTKLADLGNSGGTNFRGGVTAGPGGVLFGTAVEGGAKEVGTLFKVTTDGAFTKLQDIDPAAHGSFPAGLVSAGSDDLLYFTTNQNSKLLSATATGTLTSLADLDAAGINKANDVIEASDGSFYGTSINTSSATAAAIFRYTPGIGTAILFDFENTTAKVPRGRLIEGPDGALYGTTVVGGAFNKGTVFRITKGGTFKLLASFSGNNGSAPQGGLVLGRDGNFYGLASRGGLHNLGTVFRVSPTGKLNTVASFNGFNGAYPFGGLALGPGGNLYGVASAGGGGDKLGTLFKVSTGGAITVLQTFDGTTNGAFPTSTLTLAPDGYIYGSTYSTIFRVLTVNQPPVAKNDTFTLPTIQKNVIGNDTDPDKDRLTIVSTTDGAHGTVEFTADGTVTYTPGPDFDSPSVTTDSFTYTVSDGIATSTATVTVSVPEDFLRAGAGVYGGVLTLGGETRGYWLLGTTGGGLFTGAIYVDGVKTPIKGFFTSDGAFVKQFTRTAPLPPLDVVIQLDVINAAVTGTVTAASDVYSVALVRKLPLYSSSRPTPRAGRYTVLLTPAAPGGLIPGGTGFAQMTVSVKGAVTIVGKLGDGAPFAGGSFLSSDDEVPFYAQAYIKKKGYVAGLLTFADLAGSDVSGSLYWKKPEQAADDLYPQGFDTTTVLTGARYTQASPALPVVAQTPNATLSLENVLSSPLNIATNNTVTNTSGIKVKINAKLGTFTGTYPDGGTRRVLGGVIYQKGASHGEGLFFSETSTGKAIIVPIN